MASSGFAAGNIFAFLIDIANFVILYMVTKIYTIV